MAIQRKPAPASPTPDRSESRASDATMQGDVSAVTAPASKRDRLNEKLGSPPGLQNAEGERMHSHHFGDSEIAGLRKTFIKVRRLCSARPRS